MAKQVDQLKKERYKQERLKGNSIVKSLENSGYAPSTARQSSFITASKQGEAELMAQVKSSDITVDWVVNRLTNELVAKDAKASDRIRVMELLGKYLNMFRDNNLQQVQVNVNDILSKLKENDTSSSRTTT